MRRDCLTLPFVGRHPALAATAAQEGTAGISMPRVRRGSFPAGAGGGEIYG
jgi:hypothetical protein